MVNYFNDETSELSHSDLIGTLTVKPCLVCGNLVLDEHTQRHISWHESVVVRKPAIRKSR